MDGTLIDSTRAAELVWGQWAGRFGLDAASFLPTIHGRRAVETVAALELPGVDAAAEAAWITAAEIAEAEGIVPIGGALSFLAALPPSRWAIVTSAPRALALARLQAAGIPLPGVLVTAEDVESGKPAPDCFVLAARRLGVAIADCLVVEDSPAGIRAGEAAGAQVLVITATHVHPRETPWPSVAHYHGLAARIGAEGALHLESTG